MSSQITPITNQTYRQAAQVLGRAFADEPVSVAIYRNFSEDKRARALAVDFSAELAVCVRKGYPVQIIEDGKVIAAALIYPPGAYPLPQLDQWVFLLKSLLGNGWYDIRSWMHWISEAEKDHPTVAHYYLEYIGVEPAFQGKGYGSKIMDHLAAKADHDGVGCYLENAYPRNVVFYQHFGFQIVKEKEIIGLPAWFMWREPACSHQP